MTSPTDASPSTDDLRLSTEQSKNCRPRPTRLNQALAWVGIVAGGLFIVAAIFFSGFFLSWSLGGPGGAHKGPGSMACCSEMKPGEQMKPGEMMPGGMMGPASQLPTPPSPNPHRP